MRKISNSKFILSLVLILYYSLHAQWININNNPDVIINDLYFADENSGFILSNNGYLFRTLNGGELWERINLNTNVNLSSISFPALNIGYISGQWGIFKTTNSGNNWEQINQEYFGLGNKIFFVDSLTGYLINGVVKKTTDGGINWQTLFVGDLVNAIFFISDSVGFVGGYYGNIYKTTNGGISWKIKYNLSGKFISSMFFVNNNIGYAIGEGTLSKTINGGDDWNIVNDGNSLPSDYIFFIDINNGFNCEGNVISKTTDGGLTWENFYTSGAASNLSKIHFANTLVGYVVGGWNGLILKTSDGGETWIDKSINTIPSNDLYSVSFGDSLSGYAVGEMGTIIKTTDKGLNWENISISSENTLHFVQFISKTTGFISCSGDSGQHFILVTSDGGETWDFKPYGGGGKANSLFFLNEETGFAVGNSRVIWKTIDGGDTWTYYYFGPPYGIFLNSIFFTDSLTGYAAGMNHETTFAGSIILKTSDGGNNWNISFVAGPDQYDGKFFNSIFFVNNEIGYAAGNRGFVVKTENSGDSWEIVRDGALNNGNYPWLGSISFIDPDNGFAAGMNGVILKTTNGGQGWGLSNIYGLVDLESVCFLDYNVGIAVGSNGGILRTENAGGIVSMNDAVNRPLELFQLSQNYPNPFNPTTKINYQTPQPAFVTLKVYDLLGREVATLVNEEKPAGGYEVEFDGNSLSSGIYFYKLQGGDYSEVKKMILLK